MGEWQSRYEDWVDNPDEEKILRPVIAAAGGIGPPNVADYAATGADVLVTSFPYTARPAEVQVRIGPSPAPGGFEPTRGTQT